MMSIKAEWDVIISGAGPSGLTLANFLGCQGVRTLVLEQLPDLIDYPRGVGVDDEALRSFQAVGLVDAVRRHTVPDQIMRFLNAKGRCLAAIAPTARPYGWPRRNGFIQPLVDRELAKGLRRFPHVKLQLCSRFTGYVESKDRVTVAMQPLDYAGQACGPIQNLSASYLVGCDGGRSPIRAAMGLTFEGRSESTRWLVLDIADEPIGTPNVNFVLDDEFPHVVLALPHGIRRYEFLVPPGADEGEFEGDANVQSLLSRVLPPQVQPKVIRRRVYTHHARIAPSFRKGRVLLAGDAAHLMPVWQGQGFNTGIRDASNLGWKLGLVVSGVASDGLLDTYTQERHPHAQAMIDLSVLVGRIFVPSNSVLRILRNMLAPWVSRVPRLRQYVAEMKFKPMPFFAEGVVVHSMPANPNGQVGKVFPQPLVADDAGSVSRFDDLIGLRFAVISWGSRVDSWINEASRQLLRGLGALSVVVRPDCQSLDRDPPIDGIVLSDVDGAFKRWFDEAPGGVIVLRPDRIIAAVCCPHELDETLAKLARSLHFEVTSSSPAAVEAATESSIIEG